MTENENEADAQIFRIASKDARHLIGDRFRLENLPLTRLFLVKNGYFPCVAKCELSKTTRFFHVPTVLKYFAKTFGHDPSTDICHKSFDRTVKSYLTKLRLGDLGNGILFLFKIIRIEDNVKNPNKYPADYSDGYFLISSGIKFCHPPELNPVVETIINEISQATLRRIEKSSLSLIVSSARYDYRLKTIKVNDPAIVDLKLHYGEHFIPVHEKILTSLTQRDGKGIVLLHGMPGSGKTHYIRYLISKIDQKKMIYVPQHFAKDLSKPTFLSFLMTHPNSILIIEDAENIVRDRIDSVIDSNQAVANLLNLADGLLGDALKIQIIATFNCDLRMIDQALLRPGRLIANHAFDRLDVNTAKSLSKSLGLGDEHINSPMTLAEIYNFDSFAQS